MTEPFRLLTGRGAGVRMDLLISLVFLIVSPWSWRTLSSAIVA
ncbi:hypothetical protein [Herbidospora mongoliensis]|nr:hypothetical protein [Herbidospora mongoliensis]